MINAKRRSIKENMQEEDCQKFRATKASSIKVAKAHVMEFEVIMKDETKNEDDAKIVATVLIA